MRDYLYIVPLTLFYLILKSTLFLNVPLPDITLLIVFHMAFKRPTIEVAVLAFALGYVEDAFTGGIVGSSSFALVAVFLAVHILSRRMHLSTAAINAGIVFVLSISRGLITHLMINIAGVETSFAGYMAIQAILTGIFTPMVLSFLAKLSAMVKPRAFAG